MTELQKKVHPVDAEPQQRSTASLMPLPHNASGSGKGVLAGNHYPPFIRSTIPLSHYPSTSSSPPRRSRRRTSCCCWLCWALCLLLLLLLLVAATAVALYLIYQPKLPKYSVDRLRISSFSVDPLLNVDASFGVTITATNPNDNIGIYYDHGSHLSVSYHGFRLCSGRLPVFYQGHRNTTVLQLVLSGRTRIGTDVSIALQVAQRMGDVPLDFHGYVPVRVKLGGLKLRKVKFLVTCRVVVNSLSVQNQISIKSGSCSFKLRL